MLALSYSVKKVFIELEKIVAVGVLRDFFNTFHSRPVNKSSVHVQLFA